MSKTSSCPILEPLNMATIKTDFVNLTICYERVLFCSQNKIDAMRHCSYRMTIWCCFYTVILLMQFLGNWGSVRRCIRKRCLRLDSNDARASVLLWQTRGSFEVSGQTSSLSTYRVRPNNRTRSHYDRGRGLNAPRFPRLKRHGWQSTSIKCNRVR